MSHPLSYSFGEVLFDCFEYGNCLGGAPLNFAWNLRQFGFPVAMVSAVGRDTFGGEILKFLDRAGIDRTWVTERPEPTGTVDVHLVHGEPDFTINEGVAWDHIEVSSKPDPTPALLYFGTVAQRSESNRNALRLLLDCNPRHRFFDINLRQRYYSDTVILDSLQHATILKLNEMEWEVVSRVTQQETPEDLLERFGLKAIALTQGEHGAELYVQEASFYAEPPTVSVVDTVGAGDAFSAVLAAGMMRDADPALILDTACAAGAAVVQQSGAHVALPDKVLKAFE